MKLILCVDTGTTPRHSVTAIHSDPSATCSAGTLKHLPYRSSIEKSTTEGSLAPLSVNNPKITKAVIAVHPAGSDPDSIFRAIRNGGGVNSSTTLIVAPQFLPRTTGVDAMVLQWPENVDTHPTKGWVQGDVSVKFNVVRVSTFDVMDKLIRTIIDLNSDLEEIVVVGFSRGANFTNRYSIATRVEEEYSDNVGRKVYFRYAMQAPGSYLYFSDWRVHEEDRNACLGFNHYRYGTDLNGTDAEGYGRMINAHYIRNLPKAGISFIDNVKKKKRFFLVGDADNFNGGNDPCGELLQGDGRVHRMQQYVSHLQVMNAHTDADSHPTITSCVVSDTDSETILDHTTLVLRQNAMLNFLKLDSRATSTDWQDFVDHNNNGHCNEAMTF